MKKTVKKLVLAKDEQKSVQGGTEPDSESVSPVYLYNADQKQSGPR